MNDHVRGQLTDPSSGGRTPTPPVPPPRATEGEQRTAGDGSAPAPPPPAPPTSPRPEPTAPGSEVERPGLDDRERTLDRKIVNVWRVTGALAMIVPLGILVTVGFVAFEGYGWIAVGVAAVLLWLRVGWLPTARYSRWRWKLTSLALELRYGVVVRQYEAVPYFRIQQIDITQGPIDRMLGLATLVVTTASASGSATLPGIAAEDAPPIRAELLARAAEAVAEHPGDLQDAV